MNDSIPYFDILRQIEENTKPFLIQNIKAPQLALWSLVIALASLIVGVFAAYYSRNGYKYQKKATNQLESLIPGQISYYGIVASLIKNIITIEAVYFGKNNHKLYPIKLILSMAKLPDDLLKLEKYEKNQTCFEDAYTLKISWQNYNDCIDNLMDYSYKEDDAKTKLWAQNILDLSKAQICRIQRFEETLIAQHYIAKQTTSNESISFYIMDRFLESLNLYQNNDNLDTSRSNLNKDTVNLYIMLSPYITNTFNMDEYLSIEHKNSLEDVGDIYASMLKFDPKQVMQSIKDGDFDSLGNYMVLPEKCHFKDMDFSDFKNCYYNYIEPILIAYKRKTFLC